MYKNLPDMDYWVVSVKRFGEKEQTRAFATDEGGAHAFASEMRRKGFTVAIWDMFHERRDRPAAL